MLAGQYSALSSLRRSALHNKCHPKWLFTSQQVPLNKNMCNFFFFFGPDFDFYLSLIFLRRSAGENIVWVNAGSLCSPGRRSSALIPTWTNEKVSMDQMAGTESLRVFLTVCPLARCGSQTVLPKVAYVTLSHWPALHAGVPLHPTFVDIRKVAGSWGSALFVQRK